MLQFRPDRAAWPGPPDGSMLLSGQARAGDAVRLASGDQAQHLDVVQPGQPGGGVVGGYGMRADEDATW